MPLTMLCDGQQHPQRNTTDGSLVSVSVAVLGFPDQPAERHDLSQRRDRPTCRFSAFSFSLVVPAVFALGRYAT